MESSGSYIVFDTGVNPFLAGLGLKKLGINKDKVSHVFLTHSDYDHIGGLGLYKNAEVYISAEKKRLGSIHALNDRDVVNVNKDSIQIIFSPGHTDDSACYLINGKILVAGDTLRISCDKRFVPFLPFQNRNHAQNKASLQMLTDEGFLEKSELVLSAHTGFVKKEAGL
jgi:glyoxylase-like metal-dependent hydrolase (beta-lactamase superfamily II)